MVRMYSRHMRTVLTQYLAVNLDDRGPMNEYDDRVAEGRLRDDEHQRG